MFIAFQVHWLQAFSCYLWLLLYLTENSVCGAPHILQFHELFPAVVHNRFRHWNIHVSPLTFSAQLLQLLNNNYTHGHSIPDILQPQETPLLSLIDDGIIETIIFTCHFKCDSSLILHKTINCKYALTIKPPTVYFRCYRASGGLEGHTEKITSERCKFRHS